MQTTPYAVRPKSRMKASACKTVTHILVGAARFHVCACCVLLCDTETAAISDTSWHHGNDIPGHGMFQAELNCTHTSDVMWSLWSDVLLPCTQDSYALQEMSAWETDELCFWVLLNSTGVLVIISKYITSVHHISDLYRLDDHDHTWLKPRHCAGLLFNLVLCLQLQAARHLWTTIWLSWSNTSRQQHTHLYHIQQWSWLSKVPDHLHHLDESSALTLCINNVNCTCCLVQLF